MRLIGNVFAFDLVGFPSDQDRKHIAPCQNCVDLDFATIQAAAPACVRTLEFKPVILSVDRNVIEHKKVAGWSEASYVPTQLVQHAVFNPTLRTLTPSSNLIRQLPRPFCSQDSEISFRCQQPMPGPGLRISRRRWLRL